jgi:hypothetical protein
MDRSSASSDGAMMMNPAGSVRRRKRSDESDQGEKEKSGRKGRHVGPE